MIALAEGVTVYAGGRTWKGEIPENLCPAHLKPAAPAGKEQPTEVAGDK